MAPFRPREFTGAFFFAHFSSQRVDFGRRLRQNSPSYLNNLNFALPRVKHLTLDNAIANATLSILTCAFVSNRVTVTGY
jgi:hypothetical protein